MKLFIIKPDHRFDVEIAAGGLHFSKKSPTQVSEEKVEEVLRTGFLIEFSEVEKEEDKERNEENKEKEITTDKNLKEKTTEIPSSKNLGK